jgi:hypothetical protein
MRTFNEVDLSTAYSKLTDTVPFGTVDPSRLLTYLLGYIVITKDSNNKYVVSRPFNDNSLIEAFREYMWQNSSDRSGFNFYKYLLAKEESEEVTHKVTLLLTIPTTKTPTDEDKVKFRHLFSARLQGYYVDPKDFLGSGGTGELTITIQ